MPNQHWNFIRRAVRSLALGFVYLFTAWNGYSATLVLPFGRTSQLLNNFGPSTGAGEPIPCGVISGTSKWLGFRTVTNAALRIDTVGSRIDTVLALYTGSNLLNLTYLACDDNSAPDGLRS